MWFFALSALAADLTADQSQALKRLKGEVEWAWDYHGPAESTPPAGRKYVGADLTLYRYSDVIALTAIEAYDAASGEAAGSPQYACLGPSDMKAPCEAEGEHLVRVRLVWSVPANARELSFSLWEKKLGKAKLEKVGPTLPRNEVRDLNSERPPQVP